MKKLTDKRGYTIYVNPHWIISVSIGMDSKTTILITIDPDHIIEVSETVSEVIEILS